MIQVNRIYLIFNRLVTKKFLVDTSECLIIIVSLLYYSLLITSAGFCCAACHTLHPIQSKIIIAMPTKMVV